MKRKTALMVGFFAAATLTVSAVVGVAAQTPSPTPGPTPDTGVGSFISKLAANLGLPVDQVDSALKKTANQIIDEQVAAGKLTPEKAAQLKQRIAEGKGLPAFGGPGGPKVGGHRPGGKGPGMGAMIDIKRQAAEILGVDARTLMQELRVGKSLAQIAQEHGKSRDEVKSAIIAKATELLDKAVAEGKITAEQKQQALDRLNGSIDTILDATRTPGERPNRLDGRRPGPTATATTTAS